MSAHLAAVHIGPVAVHPDAGRTAFIKAPVTGAVALEPTGLAGDAVGNRRVHGGPEKAVYSYPQAHYPLWAADLPDHAARFVPGGMGENLVITGADEHSICIGDIIGIGSAVLQVAQPREPCNTLARIIGTPKVVRLMVRTGRCGWYSRVLSPGDLAAGDEHRLLDRPNPEWSVYRFSRFAAGDPLPSAALEQLCTLEGLTPAWQIKAEKALARLSAPPARP
jgi:MOSC domain-containing protein YiiM